MEFLIDLNEHGVNRLLNDGFELNLGLNVVLGWHELVIHRGEQPLVLGERKVLDARVNHEVEEVEDESLVVPQIEEGLHTLLFEGFVVLVLVAAHRFDHLLADADGRLQHVLARGVLTEDKAKVDVEEVARVVNHKVLQVPVTHRHEIRHRTVARTASNVGFQDLLIPLFVKDALRGLATYLGLLDSTQLVEEVLNAVVMVLQDVLNSRGAHNELQHAILLRECQSFVRRELEVKVDLLKKRIHETNNLKDQLILSHVISALVYHRISLLGPFSISSSTLHVEIQLKRAHGALEQRALGGLNTAKHRVRLDGT